MILEEFDPTKEAVINPAHIVSKIDNFPKTVISCFSRVTFNRLVDELNGEQILSIGSASVASPVYKAKYKGTEIALFNSFVSAPICIGGLEDLRELGAEKFIIFGTCGVLDKNISDCSVIIPTSAIRDEGTSYHYAPSSDEIDVNEKYITEFKDILNRYNVDYSEGKVWTTDAFYRETPLKVKRRKEQGCICVDMECSATAAFAKFRGVDVFHFFYAADNLDAAEWDKRSLSSYDSLETKDRIATLALALAVEIDKK